jgi:SAM-dependent methyltransferase
VEVGKNDERFTLSVCGCCGASGWVEAGSAQGAELRRCVACGTLRFASLSPPDVVYRDGYHFGESDFGWDYADQAESGYEEAMAHDRLAWVEHHLAPGRLVDVGGGLGYLTAVARQRGWEAELLEPVAAAVSYARERLGVPAVLGGIEALPQLEGAYDCISVVHCLEHIPDARDALAGLRAKLTPTGLVFLEVPNHGSVARRLQGGMWLGWQAGEHAYLFTRKTLLGLVERSGFEVVAARTCVPGWDGLLPDGYAHMLGLQRALNAGLAAKRRLLTKLHPNGTDPASDHTWRAPVAIRDAKGIRRFLYGPGFDLLARGEETLGLGTNLQVLARPRP